MEPPSTVHDGLSRGGLFARETGVVPPGVYAFKDANQAAFPVAVMGRVLSV